MKPIDWNKAAGLSPFGQALQLAIKERQPIKKLQKLGLTAERKLETTDDRSIVSGNRAD